jgi:hypothetical protein
MSNSCQFKISALKSAIRIPKPGTRPKGGSPQDKSSIYKVLVFLANVGILAQNFCVIDAVAAAPV